VFVSALGCGATTDNSALTGGSGGDASGGEGGADAEAGAGGEEQGREEGAFLFKSGFRFDPIPIELPRVVERSLSLDEDGKVALGEPVDIDGAETCIIARRDINAVLEPYQELDEPICVTTKAGEIVKTPGAFPYSDMTITVSREGYLPVVLTHRVTTASFVDSSFLREAVTVLFERGQAELFESPPGVDPTDAEQSAFVSVEFHVATGTDVTEDINLSLEKTSRRFPLASGAHVDFLDGEGQPVGSAKYDRSPLLLRLPPDFYRVQTSHPGAVCDALLVSKSFSIWGLPTGESEEIELRTLPGHVTHLVGRCACRLPPSETAALTDPSSCTYEEP
jgi:hypothetical protein